MTVGRHQKRRQGVLLAGWMVMNCFLASCVDGPSIVLEEPASPDVSLDSGTPAHDVPAPVEDIPQSPEPVDAGPPPPPVPGSYGTPCESSADCTSGPCIPDGASGVCTRRCSDECAKLPDGRLAWCRSDPSISGELVSICFPEQKLLCSPCLDDSQCDGGRCIRLEDEGYCTVACGEMSPCPVGFRCDEAQPYMDETPIAACLPLNSSCSCTPERAGSTRVCRNENAHGSCTGEERCDAESGWTDCSAPLAEAEICNGLDENCNGIPDDGIVSGACDVPGDDGTCPGVTVCRGVEGTQCIGPEAAPESCDHLDNDCDGETDEDFKNEAGVFGLVQHCGGCAQSCEGRISFASRIQCDPGQDPPRCVVLECQAGYRRVGDASCIPLRDATCTPCTDNADCDALSPGARCITLGAPDQPETVARVCGRDCAPSSPYGSECEEGFACQAFVDGLGETEQCVPAGGSCLCRDNPVGFSVPCNISHPENPLQGCQGQRPCEGDRFGACVPPPDSCNGLDDDCDGVVDNEFRDAESGRYTLDPRHCGRCNRDCSALAYPNASAGCDVEGVVPRCEMECDEGFVDLENGSDDGCECQILAAVDLPDGSDQNCDGIDGEVEAGVFVSKVGDDLAAGTPELPLLTIQAAIHRALAMGLRDVYVATGVYSENVTLGVGINVFGGYSLDFIRRDPDLHQTTILGTRIGAELATLNARDVDLPTRFEGFTVYGVDAAAPGRSSYAVYIRDSDQRLVLRDNHIVTADGADGGRGQSGDSGHDGPEGNRGVNAIDSHNLHCRLGDRAGGTGGPRVCEGVDRSGGRGGAAQCPRTQRANGLTPCVAMIDDCRNSCTEAPCNPLPPPQGRGQDGSGPNGGQNGGASYDRWSSSGDCSSCGLFPALRHQGSNGGHGGHGGDGNGGEGCEETDGDLDAQGRWQAATGEGGRNGDHGSGGAGGSAGSGFDATPDSVGICSDKLGGSGGGGGAGGCRGTGAEGGAGGGGSFAIVIHLSRAGFGSLPILEENSLIRGVGGDGGDGGNGGVGGRGGLGAAGGVAVSAQAFCTEPGGRGGNGGAGGAGGGGGGGCGGNAAGILLFASGNPLDAAAYRDQNLFLASGRGGRGGRGGASTGASGGEGVGGTNQDIIQR